MESRRAFLAGVAASGAMLSSPAQARPACGLYFNGIRSCTVGLSSFEIEQANAGTTQEMTQWCWAACLSSIFAWHEHPISQDAIVRRAFGAVANIPANGQQIFNAINGNWIDKDGRKFHARASVLVDYEEFYQDPTMIWKVRRDLDHNQPLIVGALGHATVLTALTYAENWYRNWEITQLVVRDPWPGRPNRRVFSRLEAQGTMFVAQVRVWHGWR